LLVEEYSFQMYNLSIESIRSASTTRLFIARFNF
jgi:hypothetical protein